MMKILSIIIALTFFVIGCKSRTGVATTEPNNECEKLKSKSEIERVIKRTMECNSKKDIGCFMESFDSSFVLESPESAVKIRTITKDSVQKDILRDWSITSKIFEVERWIDSIYIPSADSAIVFTNQFYHRTFLRPNGQPGEDDVVTTQKHRELWVKRIDGWKQQRIRELGGSVYVNGKPYNPQ
jgi:hypothetical protein